MNKHHLLLLLVFCMSFSAHASDGTISIESPHSVNETADRFVAAVKEKGLTLFTRIDHAANAEGAELTLPPTQVVVFGNPAVGTPLMQCAPKVALDLPQRALFWQDGDGKAWVSYNDPSYLKIRYSIEGCDPILNKISKVLSLLSTMAISK